MRTTDTVAIRVGSQRFEDEYRKNEGNVQL